MNENPLEKKIEANNKKYAEKFGIIFEKFKSPQKRSVPDQMLTFRNGLIAFIEYKRLGKHATEKQFRDHQKRRANNVLVYVIDEMASGRWLINRLRDLDNGKHWYIENEAIENRNHYVSEESVTRLPEHGD